MRKIILEITVAAALTLAAILSLATGAHANGIVVTGAYARASAVPAARAGAVYFTIVNGGAEADRLLRVSSEVAAEAMMHLSEVKDGVATMSHADAVDISAGGKLVFAPGGYHVMLVGLKKPLKEGEHFSLTLEFEKAGVVTVDVPIGGVAANSPP